MAEFTEGFDELASVGPAVSIFGSARAKSLMTNIISLAEKTAAILAKAGFAVITGGGGGIMEAANKGAAQAGGISIGLNIELPVEQIPNKFPELTSPFQVFFLPKGYVPQIRSRLYRFSRRLRNLDEFSEAIVLIQTLKQASFPVVLGRQRILAGTCGLDER